MSKFGLLFVSMRHFLIRVLMSITAVVSLSSCMADSDDLIDKSVANVILFIGDGMDEHQIAMARNYAYGVDGQLVMEGFAHRSSAKVLTVDEIDPKTPLYVADSANSATTIATGVVTSKGRIATTARQDEDVETIVELAKRNGIRTGMVTTASITDATPAAFVAHVNARSCQGPAEMAGAAGFFGEIVACEADMKRNGGRGSIAEQIVVSQIDIAFGGGLKFFNQAAESNNGKEISVLDQAKSEGYRVLRTKEKLESLSTQSKVLGLFDDSTLATEWNGENGRKAERIKLDENGYPLFLGPFECEPNPGHQRVPSLELMTSKALELLNLNNEKGFFLMVEGASIDKQSHFRNPCGQIGEVLAFDKAVAVGQAFARAHPGTLIIVTADHGQAGQVVSLPNNYQQLADAMGKPQYTGGYYAVLKTREGSHMAVNYGTNSAPQPSFDLHTGINVPVYLQGPGADKVPGLIRQSDIFYLMSAHLGLEK